MKQNCFPSYFKKNDVLPAFLLGGAFFVGTIHTALPALSQVASSRFSLCGSKDCNQALYYIGYNRTNSARLQGKEAKLSEQPDNILLNASSSATQKSLPDIDERYVDREDGNFVSSIHRIETAEVGFLRKSERMYVHSYLRDSAARATVKLFWGDTLTVVSRTLPKGSPVTILIERNISGFGNPVRENASYQANFKTFLNGQSLNDLDFNLKREIGKGQTDKATGKDKVVYTLSAKVGDTFKVESLMEVTDGVKGDTTAHQMLNGADSVQHTIKLVSAQSNAACIQSASGKLSSGRC